jgi:hypothetical protein
MTSLLARSASSLSSAIASPEQLASQVLAVWREAGLGWKPQVRWFPRVPVFLDEIFNLLFEPADSDDVDAILFSDERRSAPLHNIRDFVGGLQVPMIDLGGRAGDFTDAHFDLMEPRSWAETARRIVKFRQGREALALQYRHTVDPDIQILAHMYVSGRQLRGMRYPLTPEAICYPGFFSASTIVPIADRLVLRGFLKKTFFDRLHECRTCRSRRLSVREECPSCRSADLRETSLIHHFHCAALLPEEQYRQGTALICPKCKRQLRNYGKDYDRPGRAYICNTCDATSSELEVGFVCLDCNARMDGEGAERVDLYSYALTDACIAFLEGSAAALAATMPISLQREIARIHGTANAQAAVAEVRFAGKDELISSYGRSIFEKSRDLFLENIRNRLGGAGSLHVGEDIAYILAEGFDAQMEQELRTIVARSEDLLRHKLDARLMIAQRLGRALP